MGDGVGLTPALHRGQLVEAVNMYLLIEGPWSGGRVFRVAVMPTSSEQWHDVRHRDCPRYRRSRQARGSAWIGSIACKTKKMIVRGSRITE